MVKFKKGKMLAFAVLAASVVSSIFSGKVSAEIDATHVYHNHMPNFWPYYNTKNYDTAKVGDSIRYMYDGQVLQAKTSTPSDWPFFLPSGKMMPHDDLKTYYSCDAKQNAYTNWPWQVANDLNSKSKAGQVHVTMSGAVINNVQSFFETGNPVGLNNPTWGKDWTTTYTTKKTTNGYNTLDLIHFTGHHSMGPLVGNDYFLKDLIYQNVTAAQPYFLGSSFKSSKGFFPTELGFSERLIPVLDKLGIKWSVLGNNHYSRTLTDYPLLNDAGKDCLVSPPNRADLQNSNDTGEWKSVGMAHEQQTVVNKFPFASTPHYVKYVDPATGKETKIAGIPVDQNGSWLEGWEGEATANGSEINYSKYETINPTHPQYFVVAHDGDNSSGRAGSSGTWFNAQAVTYSQAGVTGMGVDEYLKQHPIDTNDVAHVQDGSWIDTRDSASDPQWGHWNIPFGIWKGQFADFNKATGLNLAPKTNLDGAVDGMTVSFEYGYHYLERNFALLQPAMNYAKTAEQIWLDSHPNYWSPTTALDKEVTYPGNQLNPWMMSFPVKGDAANDYKGGANPAELGWYFLIPAIDSGFGYYDENQDDGVKPTLSFNQSLYFTKPYVTSNLDKDKTGPSVWWPQRWPYNPGSVNCDKSEGWTKQYFDNTFGIFTYADDVNGIKDIKVKVRPHLGIKWDSATGKWTGENASKFTSKDNTFRVYDPKAAAASGATGIEPSLVGDWKDYSMKERDLSKDINGVAWQATSTATFQKVPAQEIGSLYYSYITEYRDQLLDYYIEATDSKGNVTKSDIQTVYVGSGKYKKGTNGYVEDSNGTIEGTHPFITDGPISKKVDLYVRSAASSLSVQYNTGSGWSDSTPMAKSDTVGYYKTTISYTGDSDNVKVRYVEGGVNKPSDDGVQVSSTKTYTISKDGTLTEGQPVVVLKNIEFYVGKTGATTATVEYKDENGSWTSPISMESFGGTGRFKKTLAYTGDFDGLTIRYSTDGGSTWSAEQKLTEGVYTADNSDTFVTGKPSNWSIVATIYYKKGTDMPYAHWRPEGGTWTAAPGTIMQDDLAHPGYAYLVLDLGKAQKAEVCFNNGKGTWDSNGGKNYSFSAGDSIYDPTTHVITPGAPGGTVVTVDKTSLKKAISDAQSLYDGAVEGSTVGLYKLGSKATLKTAMDTAKLVSDGDKVTQAQVDDALNTLNTAIITFKLSKVTEDIPSIADLPINTVLIGNKAYDISYLFKKDVSDSEKQEMINASKASDSVYCNLSSSTNGKWINVFNASVILQGQDKIDYFQKLYKNGLKYKDQSGKEYKYNPTVIAPISN